MDLKHTYHLLFRLLNGLALPCFGFTLPCLVPLPCTPAAYAAALYPTLAFLWLTRTFFYYSASIPSLYDCSTPPLPAYYAFNLLRLTPCGVRLATFLLHTACRLCPPHPQRRAAYCLTPRYLRLVALPVQRLLPASPYPSLCPNLPPQRYALRQNRPACQRLYFVAYTDLTPSCRIVGHLAFGSVLTIALWFLFKQHVFLYLCRSSALVIPILLPPWLPNTAVTLYSPLHNNLLPTGLQPAMPPYLPSFAFILPVPHACTPACLCPAPLQLPCAFNMPRLPRLTPHMVYCLRHWLDGFCACLA